MTPLPARIVGIYGFDFMHPFTVGGIDFVPLYKYPECEKRASDPDSFQLTGYGRFRAPTENDQDDADKVRLITAGMTFIKQQQVIAMLVDISQGDTVDAFVETDAFRHPVASPMPRHALGDLVQPDAWSRNSRAEFLSTFLQRFRVEHPGDALRQAFFRHIEIARLATPYVEIHHFLAFSALELLARSLGPYHNQKNAAVPIADLLNARGFSVQQVEVERWTHARNKAFHEGQLTTPDPNGGVDIRLADQLVPITSVLGDVLLKLLPFDDGHINWNRWRDRMAFC